jgi:Leucine-rich repeat (LRR) protein
MSLYGTIPTENGLLTSLEILNLDSNNVIGTIPTELCQLSNLYHLNLGHNMLTGSIPTEIGLLSNLEHLMLNSNPDMSGSVPTTITQLTSLQTTFLDGTNVTSGVNQICTLPNFRTGGNMAMAFVSCDSNASNDTAHFEESCDCCRCK